MKQIFFLFLVSVTLFTSCREISGRRIRGSGHITSESRHVGNFENLDISGAINAYVTQGENSSVRIEADDNLLNYIEVRERGNTLEVFTRRGFRIRPSRHIRVYISNPSYRHFEVTGASNLYSENRIETERELGINLTGASKADMDVKAPRVVADLTGASNIKLKGETREFRIDGSGASKVNCFDLLSEETSVDLTGAGHAEVHASVKLNVDVTGAASVRYKGNAQVSQRTSGAASVRKED